MCIFIYIYLKICKTEAFLFVEGPLTVLEKWKFHLAAGVCAIEHSFSFMPKKTRLVLGGGMRKLPPPGPCGAGRITYVLEVRRHRNSLSLLAKPGSSVEMVSWVAAVAWWRTWWDFCAPPCPSSGTVTSLRHCVGVSWTKKVLAFHEEGGFTPGKVTSHPQEFSKSWLLQAYSLVPSKPGDEGGARQCPSSGRPLLAKCPLLPSCTFRKKIRCLGCCWVCKKGSEAAFLSQG